MHLLVPPGQLPIGEALIKAMYEKQPDLSALSQQQQLQLLQLADAYAVEKVSFAVCRSLSKLSIVDMDWTTAVAVFTLPESCSRLQPWSALKKAASSKLQHKLGDLDLIWTKSDKRQQQQQEEEQQLLLGLPFAALLLMLSLDSLKAASEDTVFYTMDRWLHANSGTTTAQMQQFSQVLRLLHCSPTYISTVICSKTSWVRSCFSDEDLFDACALSSRGTGSICRVSTYADAFDPGDRCASWLLPSRPASVVQECKLIWDVPVADVKAKFEETLSSRSLTSVEGPKVAWQGRVFYLGLQCKIQTDPSPAPGCILSVFLFLEAPPSQHTFFEATLEAQSQTARGNKFENGFDGCMQGGKGRGFINMFRLGELSSWEATEQGLRNARLVHGDGCLHLRAVVHRVE